MQLLYNTVGYPREKGRWPLNKGWCTLNVFSLSGYKILVKMEPNQGNHDRRELILRKIASDSFFPNPLSRSFAFTITGNYFQSPAPARCWTRGGSYVLCRNLIVQMNAYGIIKYLNCGEIDRHD